jgi:hypothetical protein
VIVGVFVGWAIGVPGGITPNRSGASASRS